MTVSGDIMVSDESNRVVYIIILIWYELDILLFAKMLTSYVDEGNPDFLGQ